MENIVVENQDTFSKILNNINNYSKISQSYILVGDNSYELKNYSLLFAKVLICPNKYDKDCNECNICKRISTGNYGELSIIEPTNGVIKKEEIIKLKNNYQTQSIEGKNRVYIIHEAQLLNQSSANALLKFLEEPDSNTVAIFTTTNLNLMLNTIISRCQIIKLNKNNKLDITNIKKEYNFEEEDINFIMDYLFDIENNFPKALMNIKETFLKRYDIKEKIKSACTIMLFIYKDALNYKLFNKMNYFNNETGIKNISEKQDINVIIKKITFILENIEKLEYNLNLLLFMDNLIIGIGEINNDKCCGN